MILRLVTPGSHWRYPLLVSRGGKAPESFVSDGIGRDGRFGTVVVRVESLCAKGCHALVWAPCADCAITGEHEHRKMIEVAELGELREGKDMPMGSRGVDNTHRWSPADNTCKGCGCSVSAPEAQKPCAKPYKPRPRVPGEGPRE